MKHQFNYFVMIHLNRSVKWIPLALALGDAWNYEGEEYLSNLIAIFEYFSSDRRYKSSPEKVKEN